MPEDKGFMLNMREEGMREVVALTVLRSRLKMGIHFGRTDAFALGRARHFAAEWGYGDRPMKTMKQALRWVEEMLAPIEEKLKEAKDAPTVEG